jgi:hypothetical protein
MLGKLFAIHDQFHSESGLYDALYQSDLTLERISSERGTTTVHLSGSLKLGVVSDDLELRLRSSAW